MNPERQAVLHYLRKTAEHWRAEARRSRNGLAVHPLCTMRAELLDGIVKDIEDGFHVREHEVEKEERDHG